MYQLLLLTMENEVGWIKLTSGLNSQTAKTTQWICEHSFVMSKFCIRKCCNFRNVTRLFEWIIVPIQSELVSIRWCKNRVYSFARTKVVCTVNGRIESCHVTSHNAKSDRRLGFTDTVDTNVTKFTVPFLIAKLNTSFLCGIIRTFRKFLRCSNFSHYKPEINRTESLQVLPFGSTSVWFGLQCLTNNGKYSLNLL